MFCHRINIQIEIYNVSLVIATESKAEIFLKPPYSILQIIAVMKET
jgi:hypothetical protein